MIVPNDRPRLEVSSLRHTDQVRSGAGRGMLARTCSVPAILWRTNNELLVKCSGCSADNLQRMQLDFFPHQITVLGGDGKRIHPRLLRFTPAMPRLAWPLALVWWQGGTPESS